MRGGQERPLGGYDPNSGQGSTEGDDDGNWKQNLLIGMRSVGDRDLPVGTATYVMTGVPRLRGQNP